MFGVRNVTRIIVTSLRLTTTTPRVIFTKSYYTIGEYSTDEEKVVKESEGDTSKPPDDEANYTQLVVETEGEASESEGEASETSDEEALPPCYSKYQ